MTDIPNPIKMLRRKKVILVLATFTVAIATTLPILMLANIGGLGFFDNISFFYMFPFGLYYYIHTFYRVSETDVVFNTIGWLIYVGIGLSIILIKNRRVATILYFAFVILLILNIAGCYTSLGNIN